jgi:hypothetical protein
VVQVVALLVVVAAAAIAVFQQVLSRCIFPTGHLQSKPCLQNHFERQVAVPLERFLVEWPAFPLDFWVYHLLSLSVSSLAYIA